MGNYLLLTEDTNKTGWLERMDVTTAQLSASLIPTEAMILRAEGLVDGFLGKRYTIPVVTDASNGLLQELTACIADYELFKRGSASDVPDKYKYSYEKAMDMLMKICTGELAPFPSLSDTKQTSISLTTDAPLFDYDSLKGNF